MLQFLSMFSGGAVVFFLGFFYIRNIRKTIKNSDTVIAEIIDSVATGTGKFTYVFSYEYNNKQYKVKDMILMRKKNARNCGKKVEICVDVDNPEKFVRKNDKNSIAYMLIGCLPGLIIMIFSVILFITGGFTENI